jgi:hypothetical protein
MKPNYQSIKYWMIKLKNKFQLYKRIQSKKKKKIAIKKIRIKIEILHKFYFWLKGEIENKNQFSKEPRRNQKNKD